MPERVYFRVRASGRGDVYAVYGDPKSSIDNWRDDDLHEVINAQNERIAALEAQVARLEAAKGWIE